MRTLEQGFLLIGLSGRFRLIWLTNSKTASGQWFEGKDAVFRSTENTYLENIFTVISDDIMVFFKKLK